MKPKPSTKPEEKTMKQPKNAEAVIFKPDGFQIPPHANSDRLKTLLNEIYQKQSEMAILAETILEHDLTERQIAVMVSQLKGLSERSLHNCEEFELISKSTPSQAPK